MSSSRRDYLRSIFGRNDPKGIEWASGWLVKKKKKKDSSSLKGLHFPSTLNSKLNCKESDINKSCVLIGSNGTHVEIF